MMRVLRNRKLLSIASEEYMLPGDEVLEIDELEHAGSHIDQYGHVTATGNGERMTLRCACGWAREVRLGDVTAVALEHEQQNQRDGAMARLLARFRDPNQFASTIRWLRTQERDVLVELLAWAELELVRIEAGLENEDHRKWLGRWIQVVNERLAKL